VAVTVLLFAQCAAWTGRRRLELDLEAPASPAELMERHADLRPLKDHGAALRVAVNGEFSDLQGEVRDGDEVAFMSPFSGG
jgi:molybdopterin converting factor small subunit